MQNARGTNGGTAVIFPCPESVSPFPGDNILTLLWEATHSLLWVPSEQTSLASVSHDHHRGQVQEWNWAYSKLLATVLCMGLEEMQSGTPVELCRR